MYTERCGGKKLSNIV